MIAVGLFLAERAVARLGRRARGGEGRRLARRRSLGSAAYVAAAGARRRRRADARAQRARRRAPVPDGPRRRRGSGCCSRSARSTAASPARPSAAALARVVGETGAMILGVSLLLAGSLLVTGASQGALLRRSGHAVRSRGLGGAPLARAPSRRATSWSRRCPPASPERPPVDVTPDYPDVVGSRRRAAAAARRRDARRTTRGRRESSLFDSPTRARRVPASRPRRCCGSRRRRRRTRRRSERAHGRGCSSRRSRTSASTRRSSARSRARASSRYELQLAPGTKVSKVAALKDDLSYALATTEIRILAPIPGKQAVGVEVPNLAPKLVTLGDIFDDLPGQASPLSVWLGKDISGNAVWTDLARMPHLLIAGTTGSGKSGCINTLLTSILLRATPDEVRLILIDPKRIELNYYESIPHLLTPVVSSPKEASAVLQNVVAEMERRYERLVARPRAQPARGEPRAPRARRGTAAVPAGRDRRARRPDDDLAAGRRGRGDPARAEVARRRDPPRARDAAAVGRRDHRHDQGERAVADRVRRLEPDRLARDPRHRRRREPARPGRHALQAARHVASPARPGRVRDRGGDRARSSSSAASSAARSSTRACSRRRRERRRRGRRRRRRVRPRRGPAARPRDRGRRADADSVRLAPPAASSRRLHARGPPDRHARAPRDHLGLRGLEAAPRARRREPSSQRVLTPRPTFAKNFRYATAAAGGPG